MVCTDSTSMANGENLHQESQWPSSIPQPDRHSSEFKVFHFLRLSFELLLMMKMIVSLAFFNSLYAGRGEEDC